MPLDRLVMKVLSEESVSNSNTKYGLAADILLILLD